MLSNKVTDKLSKKFWNRQWSYCCLIPLCLSLSACGGGEIAVKEAAQLRWNALIDGDFGAAYQYYTETFKSTVSLQSFRKQIIGVGLWSKAQVETVSCDKSGKRCDADVKVTVAMKMRGLPKPVETSDVLRETWVKEGVFSDWRYIKK